jgi:hypothetical protein
LPERFATFFVHDNSRSRCRDIAQFFVKQHRYDLARSAYLVLGKWYKSNPPEWSWEFELLLETVTRTEGWPSAAGIVRTNIDRQPDSPSVWAQKALTARCRHDEELYGLVVRKLLQLTPPLSPSDFPHGRAGGARSHCIF